MMISHAYFSTQLLNYLTVSMQQNLKKYKKKTEVPQICDTSVELFIRFLVVLRLRLTHLH